MRRIMMLLAGAVCAAVTVAPLSAAATEVRLTTDGAVSANPRVAMDPQGNAVVVWQDTRYGNPEILWQKFNPGGVPLSAVVRVTNTSDNSVHPDIAVDSQGTSHVVWQEGENVNGVGTVYFCRLGPSGAKVLADQALKDFSGSVRVTCPSAGVCDIVWHRFSPTDQDVYYHRRDVSGALACERRFNAGTLPAIAKTPVISSAPSGDAQLFWRDMSTSFQLHIRQGSATNACGAGASAAYNNSNAINPTTDVGGSYVFTLFELSGNIYNFQGANNACKISQGSGTSTRPSVGASGTAGFGVWQDTRDGNAEIYLCQFWGCSNLSGDVRLSHALGNSTVPDIAVDDGGSNAWIVVWQDDRDGNSEIYLTSRLLSETAGLSGTITDARGGAPIEGAQVALTQGGVQQAATSTDAQGRYSLSLLPPGDYSVEISEQRYQTLSVPSFSLSAGSTTSQDWSLEPIHITGNITAQYWPQSPEDAEANASWRWGRVMLMRDDAEIYSGYTDALGHFDIPVAALAGDRVVAELRGLYAVVYNCTWLGSCDEVSRLSEGGVVSVPPTALSMTWPSSQPVNAYMHTVRALRDYWHDRFGIDFSHGLTTGRDLETQVRVRVDAAWKVGCVGPACSDRVTMTFERSHPTVSGEADWYPIAESSDAIYHEIGHVILGYLADAAGNPDLGCRSAGSCDLYTDDSELRAIHEGLCDYFAATFNADPILCEGYKKVCPITPIVCRHDPYRRLDLGHRAPSSSCTYDFMGYRDLDILSGALWDLRSSIESPGTTDARATDSLVVGTIRTLIDFPSTTSTLTIDGFREALRTRNGSANLTQVDAAFAAHNIPRQIDPGACPVDVALAATRDADGVHLTWTPNPAVSEWSVYRGDAAAPAGTISMSDFELVAAGIAANTYTDASAAPWQPYIYAVTPPDSEVNAPSFCTPVQVDADTITTGVASEAQQALGLRLRVAPNPATIGVRLTLDGVSADTPIRIRLFDISGRLVRSARTHYQTGYSIDFDAPGSAVRKLGAGMYFLEVETPVGRITRKIVISR